MSFIVIGLIGWVLFSYFIAEVLPGLIKAAGDVLRLLLWCLWEVTKLAGKGAGWLAAQGARAVWWVASQAGFFLFILFDEWRNGPHEDELDDEADEEDIEDDEADEASEQDAYDAALALFGLTEPFTHADLKRVYRCAMKQAHTDLGGSKEQAQALNAARDLVTQLQGW